MKYWPVADLMQLARLVRVLGDCFVVRRTLQRLERDEISPREAIELLAQHEYGNCQVVIRAWKL